MIVCVWRRTCGGTRSSYEGTLGFCLHKNRRTGINLFYDSNLTPAPPAPAPPFRQAKADAAAQACLAFAASGPATILGIQPPMRPGGTASGLECDLADLLSVRSFAAKIKADKTRKVDTLVLNAGLAMNTGDK